MEKITLSITTVLLINLWGLDVPSFIKIVGTITTFIVAIYGMHHTYKSRKEAEKQQDILNKQNEIISSLYEELKKNEKFNKKRH